MKILVDTDVLLDVALDRPPFSEPAGELMDLLQQGRATGFVAWHSISNFYYICASSQNDKTVRAFLADLFSFIQIAPVSTTDMQRALSLNMKDFEDAMQAASALACGAEIIATRNLRDYVKSPIKAKSPKEALSLIQ
ncbi:type II toxin-antitoxin system VapC family toxin [Pontiella sulfatireligans]|uniref:PIN domain-containing protein n=1 Tax=Pontiella sulfatireligans TaxID=2750658 RepID=A0A6C2UV37_9BACT|nr:PIN domain-containing protein [Pontiella sulfatireligans]VGO22977.1 hypothetical protein SCARR_05076 [Pontiella sulfatireligans]